MKPMKNCLICGKEIFRERNLDREKRHEKSVTCSTRCSKTYYKIITYLNNKRLANKRKKNPKSKA